MDLSQSLSHSEGRHNQDSYDICSRKENILRQLPHINTQYSRGYNQEYSELDLLSECSTPVSYVPGRYLQLCDFDTSIEDDVKIWPVSKRPALPDVDVTSILSGSLKHRVDDGYLHSQSIWKWSRHNSASSKLVTVAVCLIVALTALGGLVAFI